VRYDVDARLHKSNAGTDHIGIKLESHAEVGVLFAESPVANTKYSLNTITPNKISRRLLLNPHKTMDFQLPILPESAN